MSLINEALKRASNAKPPAPPATEPETPLRPVEHRGSAGVKLLLLPVLFLLFVLAGWFFMQGWQAARTAHLPEVKIPVAARELPVTAPTQPNPPLVGATTGLAANAAPSSNLEASVAEPPKPTFPYVRLQGIFYRPGHPSVMINAKTVYVGDKVAKVKVLAIDRDSVTLEWNGETKVLTLE